jgi:HD-GYP domain-containing protein (c-di-GMP phosphodiesterase class II)
MELHPRTASHGLRRALFQGVAALSRTIESRDLYTAGHLTKVARLARRIGQLLELCHDRIEGLRVAATLHDVGKIAIRPKSSPSRRGSTCTNTG